ncbi:MAG TPA: SDR family NAD(P)-dependent oxidoreductase, partial [Umezawaea sp.]|nr:SDR family NAD(P)-dependent oxidoreductase [Umezawaea sp.]
MPHHPIIVITGATNGLGRIAALDLARRGARLGVVARSREKADALLAEVDADVFLADLSSVSDVRRVGAEVDAHYDRIDVLVNN